MFVIVCVDALVAAFAGGCSPSNQLLPVSGKVTLSGAPLTVGNVQLRPDASRGNTAGREAVGKIKEDGSYEVSTDGKPGARPGAYKVLVFSGVPKDPKDIYSPSTSLINKRYNTVEKTPLTIEVVPNAAPDAYDLKLTP